MGSLTGLVQVRRLWWWIVFSAALASSILVVIVVLGARGALYRDAGTAAAIASLCCLIVGAIEWVKQLAGVATKLSLGSITDLASGMAVRYAVFVGHCTSGDCL